MSEPTAAEAAALRLARLCLSPKNIIDFKTYAWNEHDGSGNKYSCLFRNLSEKGLLKKLDSKRYQII